MDERAPGIAPGIGSPAMELREVAAGDLSLFYEQQLDPAGNRMAGFAAREPADREAFTAHWARLLGDESITVRAILLDGAVAGYVASFTRFEKPEVSYWLGREFWGRGVATRGLRRFLGLERRRPLYARAAKDNPASLRVLHKCGFVVCGEGKAFSHSRGTEIEELILVLEGEPPGAPAAGDEPR